jgi:hypothetical protein
MWERDVDGSGASASWPNARQAAMKLCDKFLAQCQPSSLGLESHYHGISSLRKQRNGPPFVF